MCFVNNDQGGAILNECLTASLGFDIVNAGNNERIIRENTVDISNGKFSFERSNCPGPDDLGFNIELFIEFLLPLVTEIGRTDDTEP